MEIIVRLESPVRKGGRIRKFYCDIFGCKIIREFDDKDDIRIGDDFYIGFLYGADDGQRADMGVNYGADDALRDDEFLKAIFLEQKADNVEEMRQKIITFGVKVLDVPDPHLYFQAPGGQVFRLVAINEDLPLYEGSPSLKPRLSASSDRNASPAVSEKALVSEK